MSLIKIRCMEFSKSNKWKCYREHSIFIDMSFSLKLIVYPVHYSSLVFFIIFVCCCHIEGGIHCVLWLQLVYKYYEGRLLFSSTQRQNHLHFNYFERLLWLYTYSCSLLQLVLLSGVSLSYAHLVFILSCILSILCLDTENIVLSKASKLQYTTYSHGCFFFSAYLSVKFLYRNVYLCNQSGLIHFLASQTEIITRNCTN